MRRAAIVHFFVETTGYMLGSFRKNPLPMGFPRLATLISLCGMSSRNKSATQQHPVWKSPHPLPGGRLVCPLFMLIDKPEQPITLVESVYLHLYLANHKVCSEHRVITRRHPAAGNWSEIINECVVCTMYIPYREFSRTTYMACKRCIDVSEYYLHNLQYRQ